MSFSFPPSVIDTLNKLTGDKATLRGQAIVKLYTGDFEGRWIYSNLLGILTLSIDRSLGGAIFFRLYDPETYDLLFENELYYNFISSYKRYDEGFYGYDVAQGYIGFAFPDEAAAEAFKKSVTQLNKKMDEKELKSLHKKKFEKSEGIFSKIGRFFGGGGKEEKKEEAISKPTNVQQNMSIKFDYEKGKFDLQSLSPEMKKIFEKAGVKKKDLLDKDFAPILFEKILVELNQEAETAPEEKKVPEKASNQENTKIPPPPPNLNIPPPPKINIPPPPPGINIPKPPGINLAAPSLGVNIVEKKTVEQKPAQSIEKSEVGRDDFLAQIRAGVKLKNVDVEKKSDNSTLSVNFNQGVEESLTMTLAKAILERRKQITKNEHTSSEESPWTDSD